MMFLFLFRASVVLLSALMTIGFIAGGQMVMLCTAIILCSMLYGVESILEKISDNGK